MKKTKNYVPPKVTSGSRLCLEAAILTASNPVEVDYSSTVMGQEEESINYDSYWE
jgi:hypothetical protein